MELSSISAGGVRGAYKSSQALKADSGLGIKEIARENKTSFSEMVKEAGAEAVQTIRQSDVTGQQFLAGKVDTQTMIEATLEAEATASQIVAVRDKLVQAYQEILRMPI
jgi:flagellar hook-basal body complex protein FliE